MKLDIKNHMNHFSNICKALFLKLQINLVITASYKNNAALCKLIFAQLKRVEHQY